MKILTAIAATALLGLSMNSVANASVYFKSPVGFAGTGCSAGTVSVNGENTSTLSILFDSYDAGFDSASGQSRRASCNFAVPVHVPQGYQVSVMTADWEGFAEGRAQFKRKYFFAGQPTTRWLTSNYNAPHGKDFLQRDRMKHRTLTWAGCGRSVNLRINSNIRAKGRNSLIAMDTVDLQNKVKFHLKWRRCH